MGYGASYYLAVAFVGATISGMVAAGLVALLLM